MKSRTVNRKIAGVKLKTKRKSVQESGPTSSEVKVLKGLKRPKKSDVKVSLGSLKAGEQVEDNNNVTYSQADCEIQGQFDASSSNTCILNHACAVEQSVQRPRRVRLSSCEELKGKLRHHTITKANDSFHVVLDDVNKDSSVMSNPVIGSDDFNTVENESTSKITAENACHLTDFERFALENQDADFTDACFPAQIGEQCNLCDDKLGESRLPLLLDRLKPPESTSNLDRLGTNEELTKEFGIHLKKNHPDGLSDNQIYMDSVSNKTQSLNLTMRRKRGLNFSSDELASPCQDEPALKSSRSGTQRVDGHFVISLPRVLHKDKNGEETESGSSFYRNGLGVEDLVLGSTLLRQGQKTAVELGAENVIENGNTGPLSIETDLSAWKFSIPDWMYVAVDCEMVGAGPKGKDSILGRCSIVDFQGNVVYDKFVCPDVPITDYRTRWSGIRPADLSGATPICDALKEIGEILTHKIIVGHSVYNDFRALKMNPPFYTVRDTAQCKTLIRLAGLEGQGNSLKKLTAALLDRQIQVGYSGHCSVEDARATLDLFKLVRQEFEAELYSKWSKKSHRQILSDLASFVQKAHASRGLRIRADSNGDSQFFNDEYWPSHVTDHK